MSIHVKPENLQGDLRQHTALSTTTHWSLDHEVKIKRLKKTLLHICKILCEYSVHLLGWNFPLALQVSELSPPSHLHLPSIPFQRLLERSTGLTPKHQSTNTAKVSQVSNTTGTPLHSIFLYHSETWSPHPRPKHQALAPSASIQFRDKSMFLRVLLTFNASARASGQKRWQTMWNLRTYKAICDNIQPCPLPHIEA